jgi:predicted aldo/keto reductase-like oxidoreductase
MRQLREKLGTRFCRRCDYCQPCTAEIPISMVMIGDSYYNRLTFEMLANGWVKDVMEKAALCTECGDCEERCPYNLPIRDMIKEQAAKYQEWREANKERIAAL